MVILKMAILSELWKVDLGPFGNQLFIYKTKHGFIFNHERYNGNKIDIKYTNIKKHSEENKISLYRK